MMKHIYRKTIQELSISNSDQFHSRQTRRQTNELREFDKLRKEIHTDGLTDRQTNKWTDGQMDTIYGHG